jgi:hypothetical protein
MGWWTLGLGCLWEGGRNLLALRYLLRSFRGWLVLLGWTALWAGLGWWAWHGLAWYWAAAVALGLLVATDLGSRFYAVRELQQWESYKSAEGWLRAHPRLRPMWDSLEQRKYPPRIPDG